MLATTLQTVFAICHFHRPLRRIGGYACCCTVLSLLMASLSQAALVSYWNFNESASGTGTAFDSKGSNHGTFTGSTVRTTGLIGTGAAAYPGTNPAGVNVGTSLAFTSGVAIEAYVTSPNWDGTGFEEIFRKNDANLILLSLQAGNILSFGLNGGGGYNEFDVVLDGTGGKPNVAQFATGAHHIVAQYDAVSGLQELYYDGGLIASRTFQAGPNIISGGGASGFIGSNGGTETWDGIIDEVAFYNAPLSSEMIAAHYANVLIGQNYFFSSIPEPSTGLLLALGTAILTHRRRGNRRH